VTDLIETPVNDEAVWMSLARELAMDIYPLETILEHHQITPETFNRIKSHPRFTALLQEHLHLWNASLNARERVDLKTIVMIEEALPELNARLHDPKEPLNAKVELFKALQRGAGIGVNAKLDGVAGEKISITINMGSDKELKVVKELPTQVIEGEVADG
jgi:hypothetical protein